MKKKNQTNIMVGQPIPTALEFERAHTAYLRNAFARIKEEREKIFVGPNGQTATQVQLDQMPASIKAFFNESEK